jgi:hypothetical protein
MKDRYVRLTGAVLLALALLAGCQATPEQPVVVQKDMEQMIGMAQQTLVHAQGALAERLGAPESLQMELVSAKGKLMVHVDAAVTLPDVPTIPTVRVGMSRFSQEDVKRLYDTLCGNAVPVSPLDTQLTQAYKMRLIQDLMEQKQSGKLDDMKYESMEQLDAAIAQVMAEAAGLPEHFERVEPDFSFETQEDGSEWQAIRVAPDDATLSDLYISNSPEGMGQCHAQYFRDLSYAAALSQILVSGVYYSGEETHSPYFVPPEMSEADARKLAEETVSALGLTELVCSAGRAAALYNSMTEAEDAPRRGIYEFMFTRQIGGVPITYTGDDGSSIDATKEDVEAGFFAMPWLYEKVRVIIDNDGVLCLVWNSPYVVQETVAEDTAMLPFEDIRNTFEKMITVVGNVYDTSENGLTCDMTVTEARLGLMRVTEKDIGASGLVIPVWDFFGYIERSDGIKTSQDACRALLTINAIDGSVIDRNFGC